MDRTIQINPHSNGWRPIGDGLTLEVDLPELHADQARAYCTPGRFKAIRCGRRWGKTLLGETIAADAAIAGKYVGWFAPENKYRSEAYADLLQMLQPVMWRSSENKGVMRCTTGGRIDFWTLDNEHAGRSRKYHTVIIDEGAFTKPNMRDIWRKAIRPTLVDYRGSAFVLSNTNGIDAENWFYQICNDPALGFVQYHAPTHANPYMPRAELEEIESTTHPLVFLQEYKAEFVDWSGSAFFAQTALLDDNAQPYAFPTICDGVFAVIDTAVKDHKEHDGTGVVYFALSRNFGVPLLILDYDVIQIEGSMLEAWLPSVYERLAQLAKMCRARYGSLGAWIEDKNSGTILLQQAARRSWKASPIESKLTDLGKDARAISVSGYVHRGWVKICAEAYNRVLQYKGVTRNHLVSQIVGFRVGIDGKEDDLLDCFTYGTAIALGDAGGF